MDILDIIRTVLSSGLPCCILAIGIFITFRLLDFADMTAEGSFLIGAALTGMVLVKTNNPILATCAGALGGALCGFITGVLNRLVKIPKLLSGIITMTSSTSIAYVLFSVTRGVWWSSQITSQDIKGKVIYDYLPKLGGWNIPIIMLAVVILVALIIYFFFGTEYGMAIRSTGMNERMARAQGINTNIATIAGVAISNALIGLAGALYIQKQKALYISSATGYLIVGLASILIGEAIFGRRSFKNCLISVCLGAILYFVIITIAIKLNMPGEMLQILYAVLIVLALCIPFIRKFFEGLIEKAKKKNELPKEANE